MTFFLVPKFILYQLNIPDNAEFKFGAFKHVARTSVSSTQMSWLNVLMLLIIPKLLLLWFCCTSLLRHHNKAQMNLSSPCLGYQTCLNQPPLQCHLKLALLNTSSLSTKSLILNTDNKLDCLCLTETWDKPLNYFFLNQITPTDNLVLRDRGAELQYLQKGH